MRERRPQRMVWIATSSKCRRRQRMRTYSEPLEEAMATYALTDKAVLLRAEDDVAVAKAELVAGTVLEDGANRIEVRQDIKPGHKVARKAVRTGAPVRRYGQVIGFATQDIAVGDHV